MIFNSVLDPGPFCLDQDPENPDEDPENPDQDPENKDLNRTKVIVYEMKVNGSQKKDRNESNCL